MPDQDAGPQDPTVARVDRLFLAALALPAGERDDWLVAQCAGNAALLAELRDLLACHDDAPEALRGTSTIALPGSGRPSAELRVPGYRTLDVLGRGGSSVVHRAEQQRPRRKVALKVIHATGHRAEQRMIREAEFLARLRHPGIAQVFEAGVLPEAAGGHAWIAMELVDGIDPARWAREHDASTEARVSLVLDICDAVAHAHRHGILHRDLKPANVLVTVDEAGRAHPKLLDFGIARDLDGDSQPSLATRTGHLVGTLPYMSPEQIHAPGSVDARTDVYAIGTMLHEILTGRHPVSLDGCSLAEIARRIAEVEPTPLSAHATALRGDLETVVLTALEKDPNRRYASVDLLADDLRRYLRDEPIRARPSSRLTRALKFTRRHRALVGGTVATIAALAIGLSVTTWLALENRALAAAETRNRRAAEAAHRVAQRNLYFAEMNATAALDPTVGLRSVSRQLAHWIPASDEADQRGWEWYLLRGATRDADHVLFADRYVACVAPHPTANRFVACSGRDTWILDHDGNRRELPDGPGDHRRSVRFDASGRWIAAAGSDGVTVWDADGIVLARLELPDWGSAVALHPDGVRLAVMTFKKGVFLFDWRSGAILHAWDDGIHGDSAALDIAADGSLLVMPRLDGSLQFADVADPGGVVDAGRMHLDGGLVTSARFAADGRRLAVAFTDGHVGVVDVAERAHSHELRGHRGWALGAWLAPDGRTLWSCGADMAVRRWDLGTGRELDVFSGHASEVLTVALSHDGSRIATGSRDLSIRLWDARRPPTRIALGEPDRRTTPLHAGLRWRDDDRILIAHRQARRRHDLRRGTTVSEPLATRLRGRAGPDARWEAALEGSVLRVRTLTEPRVEHRPSLPAGRHGGLAWHLEQPRLALQIGDSIRFWSRTAPDTLTDGFPVGGEAVCAPDWGSTPTRLAGHSEAGPWLADLQNGLVRTWDAPPGRTDVTRTVAHPTREWVVSGHADGRIRIWTDSSRDRPIELAGHDERPLGFAWHPHQERLASAGFDRTVRVWDTVDGKLAATFRSREGFAEVAWSPDGMRLAGLALDGELWIWDAGPGYAAGGATRDPAEPGDRRSR